MTWTITFNDKFEMEFDKLPESVQDEIFSHLKLLETFGPSLGRPHVDTLKGSKFPNMKELRINAENGVWRLAFAFDPQRCAILLVCGNKVGISSKRFYRHLIRVADNRFLDHISQQEAVR
jgi:hypothetical protein